MDKRNSNKVCPAGTISARQRILINGMHTVVKELEKEKKLTSSDTVSKYFSKVSSFEVRRLLSEPNFMLTHKGWRNPMKGRVLVYVKSKTGFIIVIDDYLHKPVLDCERRGDYLVREYSVMLRKTISGKFFIWHKEIKDQADV